MVQARLHGSNVHKFYSHLERRSEREKTLHQDVRLNSCSVLIVIKRIFFDLLLNCYKVIT